jgi:hypothetical protein
VKARVEGALHRLGVAGVLGIGILLACAGLWFSGVKPLEDEIGAQRLAAERLHARTPYQPVSSDRRAEELRRFQGLFPSREQLTDELERVHRLARGAGLELAQGEYRLERRAVGLSPYRITLPVSGTYPQLREFLSAVLKTMPAASIDALRFERKRAADTHIEAQVRLTLHVRLTGESP